MRDGAAGVHCVVFGNQKLFYIYEFTKCRPAEICHYSNFQFHTSCPDWSMGRVKKNAISPKKSQIYAKPAKTSNVSNENWAGKRYSVALGEIFSSICHRKDNFFVHNTDDVLIAVGNAARRHHKSRAQSKIIKLWLEMCC